MKLYECMFFKRVFYIIYDILGIILNFDLKERFLLLFRSFCVNKYDNYLEMNSFGWCLVIVKERI